MGVILTLLLCSSGVVRAQSAADVGLDEADATAEAVSDVEEGLDPDAIADEAEALTIQELDNVEEIVVQGSRNNGLADSIDSDSVISFSAEDLDAMRVADVADLSKFTPNVEIPQVSATSGAFFIRGVGLNDFSAVASGAVAVMLDDIAMNSPPLQLGILYDLENIIVDRGPQSAGPSRNASAGAIRTFSRRPSGNFGGFFKSTFGNYNMRGFEGAVEAPIVKDLLSARVSFRHERRDGWLTNGCGDAPPIASRPVRPPGSNNTFGSICGENVAVNSVSPIAEGLPSKVNNLQRWGARGLVRFQPDLAEMDWLFGFVMADVDQLATLGQSIGTQGTVTLPDGTIQNGFLGGVDASRYIDPDISNRRNQLRDQFRAEGQTFREALNSAQLQQIDELVDLDPNPRRGDFNKVGKETNRTYGGYVNGSMMLPAEISFKTITGYFQYDRLIDSDLDNTSNVQIENRQDDEGWQVTQDLRVEREFGDEFTLRGGGYFLGESIAAEINSDFGDANAAGNAFRDYTQNLWNFAIYSNFTWSFWDRFTIDAGARFNWEQKTMDVFLDNTGVTNTGTETKTWMAPSGLIKLTYDWSDTTQIYWKYSRGWKPGHFNATTSLSNGLTTADPEELDAFEGGIRAAYWDNKIFFNASFFYYRYQDYQLFTFTQGFREFPQLVILNANDAENYGAEADITINPIENLLLVMNFGWLESQFLDFSQQNTITRQISIVPPESQTFPIEIDYSGNRLPNSPQFSINLTGQYAFDLGRYGTVTPRYSAAWRDTVFFDPTEGRGNPNAQGQVFLPPDTLAQSAFWLHNLRLTYATESGGIEVSLWVDNLTDETYKTTAVNATNFSDLTFYYLGTPRMFGIDLALTF